MRNGPRRGILVVGHGSRRAEANQDVREAARLIGERGGLSLVEAAFLEIEHLNISEGFARLVERGARSITVHPYFLSPGRHTRGDIPVKVKEAAEPYAHVSYRITEPLSAHPSVIEASIERIREVDWRPRSNSQTTPDVKPGTVYLVGAGPGDPGLLTVRADRLLRSCDAVIYDNLVKPEILYVVPTSAKRIYVGKVGGGRQTSQAEINRLLVDYAQRGCRVVRLKGGDPFLFGRGGEEAEALRAEGIDFEVVPGISSALAVPAYAGIPLTHREISSSVAIVTGARAEGGEARREAISSAVAGADTIVILMGVTHLREIARELIAAGRDTGTPVAIIRWGTYDEQETVTGTLETIAARADRAGIRAPAVIVVGEVVRLRERLNWFETSAANSPSTATAAGERESLALVAA